MPVRGGSVEGVCSVLGTGSLVGDVEGDGVAGFAGGHGDGAGAVSFGVVEEDGENLAQCRRGGEDGGQIRFYVGVQLPPGRGE